MSQRNHSKKVADETTSIAQQWDEDGDDGWRAAFRKASFVVDDPGTPTHLREFWRAIRECRREDAIRSLDEWKGNMKWI